MDLGDIDFMGGLLLAVVTGYVMIGIISVIEFVILMATGALAAKYNAGLEKMVGTKILLSGAAGAVAMAICIIGLEIVRFTTACIAVAGGGPAYPFSGEDICMLFCLPVVAIIGFIGGSAGAFVYRVIELFKNRITNDEGLTSQE